MIIHIDFVLKKNKTIYKCALKTWKQWFLNEEKKTKEYQEMSLNSYETKRGLINLIAI